MSQSSKSLFKGVGIGCGILTLIPILIVVVVSVRTALPLREANRDLLELESRYGSPASFTPPASGEIPAERMESFLSVRDALEGPCGTFQELLAPMARMDNLPEGQDATAGEVTHATRGIADVATRITPLIGEFLRSRNRALLNARMGLGEYTYIYALAYRDQLLSPALHAEIFSSEGALDPEALDALRSMLVQQSDAHGARVPLELPAEIAAMKQDPTRLPWAGGAPAAVTDSIAPYRVRLESRFCGSLAGIELDRKSRRALRIALE
jgi:hypothetical protein